MSTSLGNQSPLGSPIACFLQRHAKFLNATRTPSYSYVFCQYSAFETLLWLLGLDMDKYPFPYISQESAYQDLSNGVNMRSVAQLHTEL